MIHPAKLCWELKRVLLEKGVVIHANSMVGDLREEPTGMVVDTDRGSVTDAQLDAVGRRLPLRHEGAPEV